MSILPISTNTITDFFIGRTTGERLKRDLGLANFPYVMIQKVLDVPIPIYIITIDSRRPTIYLSPFKVRSADSSKIKKVKQSGFSFQMKTFKATSPMPIERSNPLVSTDTIIIFRDLAGEYLIDIKKYNKMNESLINYSEIK
jgi:hypothetical protein